MIWRIVSLIDRLCYCQHAEMLLQREPDGSLSRVCTRCAFTVQLVGKHGVVVPLHPPTGPAKSVAK